MSRIILTNNPLVRAWEGGVSFVDGAALDVLLTARDWVHRGYRLLTHPLAGSIPPGQMPCRTLLLAAGDGSPDPDSVQWIEAAVHATGRTPPRTALTAQQLLDYQRIDAAILQNARRNSD